MLHLQMVVCSSRAIAYALLLKFKNKYPEWFEEKKVPDGVYASEEELKKLKPMPFMAMVSSVGSNDEPEMYNYLGGVKNDKRSEELDASFKQEKSNFRIVIVVDMWITGFDVPAGVLVSKFSLMLINLAPLFSICCTMSSRSCVDLPNLENSST